MKFLHAFLLVALWSGMTSQIEGRGCERREQRNAGRLTHTNRPGCPILTLNFVIPINSTLVLTISVEDASAPVQILSKTSAGKILESSRIESVTKKVFRFDSRVVQLLLPSDLHRFEGRYKILSRPSGRHAPASDARTGNCDPAPSKMVQVRCHNTGCRFECKRPEFVPRVKGFSSAPCRGSKGRQKAINLCMPRAVLGALCFDENESQLQHIDCGYSVMELMQLFEREESEAGDQTPDFTEIGTNVKVLGSTSGNTSGSTVGRLRLPPKFLKLVCKRRLDNSKYKFKCSYFKGRRSAICVYMRHLSSHCISRNIFS